MKIIMILALAILTTASSAVRATSFYEFEEWTQDEFYHRGDVVRKQYDLYINVVPSRDDSPDAGTPKWKKIDYNTRAAFADKALYTIGTVVSHEGRHFISLTMNAVHGTEALADSRRWLEFTHPGLTYDLPPETARSEEINSLLGVDANFNGVRDDFERTIIFSSLPSAVKDAALSAGKAYGQLMRISSDGADVTRDEALRIVHNLVLTKGCRNQMRELHHGSAWQESTYFNTLDRIEAKFKLQNMLASILGDDGYPLPREPSPCLALIPN